VQQQFSSSIDKGLEAGLKEYRILLGADGGRGGGPRSVRVETTAGRKVLVQPGGAAKLAEPRVSADPGNPNSLHVEIASARDAGWVAKKIRDLYPNVDTEKLKEDIAGALKAQPPPRTDPTDRLHLRVLLGGHDFFRGALKATFNLLGVNDSTLALNRIFDPVREFILNGTGSPRSFVGWPTTGPVELPRLAEFDHIIAVYSSDLHVDAFVQFFGTMHWTFRLAAGYSGPEFCNTYIVDPLREAEPAEDRAPRVAQGMFVKFENGRPEQDDDVRRYFRAQIEKFLRGHLDRAERQAWRRDVVSAIEAAWGPPDARALTQTDFDRAVHAIESLTTRHLGADLKSEN
jgi:hypothetical protein